MANVVSWGFDGEWAIHRSLPTLSGRVHGVAFRSER